MKRTLVLLLVLAAITLSACGGGGGGGGASNNADLASLALSSGVLDPAFDAAVTSYTAAVSVAQVGITPTAADAGASIAVNGTAVASGQASGDITLTAGANQISVTVTAADATTTKTYTLSVTYTPLSNNAGLASLTVSRGLLNPAFATATTSYTAMFIGEASVTVTPSAADAGARITVNGASVVSGQTSAAIALNPGSNTITVVVTAADNVTTRTYTLTANRISQEAYLKASNTGAFDQFGYSIAVSGDTLAVGAYNEASNAIGIGGNQTNDLAANSGAVYVFTRTGTTWTQQAYIKASNTGANDEFGYSVALSGDTLAVGARNEDSDAIGIGGNQTNNLAADSGAVYVFTRTGTVWTQQAYIKASNTGAFDSFGASIALSGDTLAVGALYESSNAIGIGGNQTNDLAAGSGAVYVFTRTGTVWTQQAYIKASNTEAGDFFSASVALSGDTLAVGAYGEASNAVGVGGNQTNDLAANSGAVYMFTRTGTVWTQQAYIKASNTGADDAFGFSVALSGDTLAVGALFEDSNAIGIGGNQTNNLAANSGAVYVFTRTGTAWTQQAYIKASNTGANDQFGSSVALSGDTIAVGSYGEDSNATGINGDQNDNQLSSSGAVYVVR